MGSFSFNIITFTTASSPFSISSCAFQCKAWKHCFGNSSISTGFVNIKVRNVSCYMVHDFFFFLNRDTFEKRGTVLLWHSFRSPVVVTLNWKECSQFVVNSSYIRIRCFILYINYNLSPQSCKLLNVSLCNFPHEPGNTYHSEVLYLDIYSNGLAFWSRSNKELIA